MDRAGKNFITLYRKILFLEIEFYRGKNVKQCFFYPVALCFRMSLFCPRPRSDKNLPAKENGNIKLKTKMKSHQKSKSK